MRFDTFAYKEYDDDDDDVYSPIFRRVLISAYPQLGLSRPAGVPDSAPRWFTHRKTVGHPSRH